MPKNMMDIKVEQEIARLQKSPNVQLAQRYEMVRYQRLELMHRLQALEKKGERLVAAGFTMEMLNGLAEETGDW